MAEVASRDGAWTFDGEVVRIVIGHDRGRQLDDHLDLLDRARAVYRGRLTRHR